MQLRGLRWCDHPGGLGLSAVALEPSPESGLRRPPGEGAPRMFAPSVEPQPRPGLGGPRSSTRPQERFYLLPTGSRGRWSLSQAGKAPPPLPSLPGSAARVCRAPRGLLRTSPGRGWGGLLWPRDQPPGPRPLHPVVSKCGDWGCSAGCWEASLLPLSQPWAWKGPASL